MINISTKGEKNDEITEIFEEREFGLRKLDFLRL